MLNADAGIVWYSSPLLSDYFLRKLPPADILISFFELLPSVALHFSEDVLVRSGIWDCWRAVLLLWYVVLGLASRNWLISASCASWGTLFCPVCYFFSCTPKPLKDAPQGRFSQDWLLESWSPLSSSLSTPSRQGSAPWVANTLVACISHEVGPPLSLAVRWPVYCITEHAPLNL